MISSLGQTVRRKKKTYRRPENADEENFERPDQDSPQGSGDTLPKPRPNRKPPKSPLPTPKRESEVSTVSSTSQNSTDSVGTFYSRRPPPALPRTLSRSMENLSIHDEFAEYEEEPFSKSKPVIPPRGRMSADLEHMYVNTMQTQKSPDASKLTGIAFNNELSSALNRRLKNGSSSSSGASPPRRPAAPTRPPPPRRN